MRLIELIVTRWDQNEDFRIDKLTRADFISQSLRTAPAKPETTKWKTTWKKLTDGRWILDGGFKISGYDYDGIFSDSDSEHFLFNLHADKKALNQFDNRKDI